MTIKYIKMLNITQQENANWKLKYHFTSIRWLESKSQIITCVDNVHDQLSLAGEGDSKWHLSIKIRDS